MKQSRLLTFVLVVVGLIAIFELCKGGFNAGLNDGRQNKEIKK
jgi:hypothetical protein